MVHVFSQEDLRRILQLLDTHDHEWSLLLATKLGNEIIRMGNQASSLYAKELSFEIEDRQKHCARKSEVA